MRAAILTLLVACGPTRAPGPAVLDDCGPPPAPEAISVTSVSAPLTEPPLPYPDGAIMSGADWARLKAWRERYDAWRYCALTWTPGLDTSAGDH